MSLEEFYKQKKESMADDAKLLASNYYKRTGKLPDESVLREYVCLFVDTKNKIPYYMNKLMLGTGHYESCEKYYKSRKSEYENINEFLKDCSF